MRRFKRISLVLVLVVAVIVALLWLIDRMVISIPWLPQEIRGLTIKEGAVITILLYLIGRERKLDEAEKGVFRGCIRVQRAGVKVVKVPGREGVLLTIFFEDTGIYNGTDLPNACGSKESMESLFKDFAQSLKKGGVQTPLFSSAAAENAFRLLMVDHKKEREKFQGGHQTFVLIPTFDKKGRISANRVLEVHPALLLLLSDERFYHRLATVRDSDTQRGDIVSLIALAKLYWGAMRDAGKGFESGFRFIVRELPYRAVRKELDLSRPAFSEVEFGESVSEDELEQLKKAMETELENFTARKSSRCFPLMGHEGIIEKLQQAKRDIEKLPKPQRL